AELWILRGRECPPLVIRQMELQIANLVETADFHHLFKPFDGMILAGDVHHHAAVVGMRPIVDRHLRQTDLAARLSQGLENRRCSLGDGAVVKTLHNGTITDNYLMRAIAGSNRLSIAYGQD